MQGSSSASARRSQRVSATLPLSLLLEWEDSKMGHDAFTVDLSSQGARVRTTVVLSPGDRVGVVAWGDSGQAMPSRVVWVRRSSVAGSLAGIEFLGTLPA
ncbi:MAG: PilZ domain-containing protein [Terriglobia bacterium]